MLKIFNDHFAYKENIFSRIDERIKLLLVIFTLILIICSPSPLLPLIVAFLSLGFLVMVGIPLYILFFRLIAPLSIALVIFIVQIFFYGQTPLFEFKVAGIHLTGFKEGLHQGILIMSKVVGAVSLILFLTMTTSMSKLLFAASWFKIPHTFIEVAILAYRYIFVLLETAFTIKDAQKLRLGYTNFKTALTSWGNLAGAVLIKAYNQAIQTHEAMVSRGYCGKITIEAKERFKKKDILVIFVSLVALIFLTFIGYKWALLN